MNSLSEHPRCLCGQTAIRKQITETHLIKAAPIASELNLQSRTHTQIKLKGTKLNHQNFKRLTRVMEPPNLPVCAFIHELRGAADDARTCAMRFKVFGRLIL